MNCAIRASSRSGSTLAVILLCVSSVPLSSCSQRKARWNYAPIDDQSAETTRAAGERPRFDPDEMERLIVDSGCVACHSFHGERLVGPPLDRLGGAPRRFVDGSTATVDEAYVAESILEPNRRIVEGYPAVMPPYSNLIDEADAEALAAYLVSLR